jgi:hypothetical protein
MCRPYPTVHIDHEESVPFLWGSGSKPTLVCGHLPLKFSPDNSHQAFNLSVSCAAATSNVATWSVPMPGKAARPVATPATSQLSWTSDSSESVR